MEEYNIMVILLKEAIHKEPDLLEKYDKIFTVDNFRRLKERYELSTEEIKILILMLRGHQNKAIEERMGFKVAYVVRKLYHKFNCDTMYITVMKALLFLSR